MMMADDSIVERLLHRFGWHPPAHEEEDEARLRDHLRRLKVLETRVAVRERADREAVVELDRLSAEEAERESRGDR
jgi:hypothetical protein